jgi:hypothetical protein
VEALTLQIWVCPSSLPRYFVVARKRGELVKMESEEIARHIKEEEHKGKRGVFDAEVRREKVKILSTVQEFAKREDFEGFSGSALNLRWCSCQTPSPPPLPPKGARGEACWMRCTESTNYLFSLAPLGERVDRSPRSFQRGRAG